MNSTAYEKAVFHNEAPWLIRHLGLRYHDGRSREYRMRWGEISMSKHWDLGLGLNLSDDYGYSLSIHLIGLALYVRLPMLNPWRYQPAEMMDRWGLHTFDGAIHFNWGSKTWIWTLPWNDWKLVSHDVLKSDGQWVPFVGCWERDKEPDGRHEETHPYLYILQSGEVQRVNATCSVERRQWRLRWFPWVRRISHSMDVRFSGGVGEETGSWKGGTIGCWYELKPGETIRRCLKRMEGERRF